MVDGNALGRRDFLKKDAGATAGVMGFPYIVASPALSDVDKDHLQGDVNRVNYQNQNEECAAYADYRELPARKIRLNPQIEEVLYDQTATSLLGKSVCSPWHL